MLMLWLTMSAILGCGESGPTQSNSGVPAISAFDHIQRQPPGGKWLAPAKNRENFVREFRETGTLYLVGVSLSRLLAVAYGVHHRDILLGDRVVSTEYDAVIHPQAGSVETARSMLRELIDTQLGLSMRRQRTETTVMVLVTSPAGLQLRPSESRRGLLELGRGELRAVGSTMSQLVFLLRDDSKIPVIDETALTEHYDYLLEWDPTKGAYAFIQSLADIGLALAPASREVENLLVTHASPLPPMGDSKPSRGEAGR